MTNSITSTTGTTTTTGSTGTSVTDATQRALLGKDDFLKLMVAQLQHQDPLNPSTDTNQLAQMAQFSTLEQITNLAKTTQQTLAAQSRAQTLSLIGKTVSYLDSAGHSLSGAVDKVDIVDGKATLTVAGVAGVDPDSVTEVSA